MPAKKTKKAKKVLDKKIDNVNWNTTDGDEIQRRKLRAVGENIHVKPLRQDHDYYTAFLVYSEFWANYDTAKYLVEIRSLDEFINSCDCVDFQTSGLGTCKHVEKVLLYLVKKGKGKFRQFAVEGSPYIEIFLRAADNKICIQWPRLLKNRRAYKDIAAYFAADNTLLGDPVEVFSTLQTICKIGTKNKVRISSHIAAQLERIKNAEQKCIAREVFQADVEAGKRTFDLVKHPLYPYQQDGMMHLAFNERAILADEMGLGKTVQAIAACELLRQNKNVQRVLVVATASLKAEWEEQIAKFSDLDFLVIQGLRKDRLKLYQTPSFFYLTNYEQILHDGADIQRLIRPDLIILDEAQRIKNWQTKTAKAVKKLASPHAFVLTGTPLENRIDDVYSIVQFLDPHLLGSLFRFNREFYQLDEKGRPAGYKNLDELYRRLRTILLRRQKSDVEDQLPERTINHFFVGMESEQRGRYEDYSYLVARLLHQAKYRHLTREEFDCLQKYLACMRMLCDTTYILDQECRLAPKLHELEKILEELLADKNTKILIFSEWERMLQLIRDLAIEMRAGYVWHTGAVPQKKRRVEINRFKNDPNCQLFLSTDSGSVGLNLQVASVVINMDLPWNPAKLEQRIARAWRKNQKHTVKVINLVTEDSIEHRMIGLLEQKQKLATNVLDLGTTKEMDIPSGYVAFMKRLEELMAVPVQLTPTEEEPKPVPAELPPLDIIENNLFAKVPNNLLLMHRHKKQDEQKETLFIVVEEDQEQVSKQVEQTLKDHQITQSPAVEILDKQTYATLQRLAKLGIISINQEAASLLSQKSQAKTQRKQQDIRVRKSQNLLNKLMRKYDMAELLINGSFYQEALPVLKEITKKTVLAYSYARNYCNNMDADLSAELQNSLSQDPKLSDTLLLDCWQSYFATKQNDSEIQAWLTASKNLYNFVNEELTKLAVG